MTRDELLQKAVAITGADLALMKRRNTSYAPLDDAFRNLVDQATEAHETVYQSLMGHVGGKLSRVRNALFTSGEPFSADSSKLILENLPDIRNYLTLLQIYYEGSLPEPEEDEETTSAKPLWTRLIQALRNTTE